MAENKRDYYETLGISKTADEAEIKKAYRNLAKKYHPDVNPDDKAAEKKFKEVNEAYEVLSDSDKKARYDAYGHAGVDPNAAGGFGGFDFGGGRSGGGFGSFDMGDILNDFFGGFSSGSGRRSANSAVHGDDVHTRLNVTFEEAVFGCTKEISYARIETCEDCSGSGAAKGSSPETCSVCGGSGTVTTQRRMMGMTMNSTSTCQTCRGTGKIIKNPCSTCKGAGLVRRNVKKSVDITAGAYDGIRFAVGREGNAGRNGGVPGDVIITLSVKPHPVFERDGNNLYCDIPITFTEAALGGEIEVPTLEGSEKYRIGEGTQTGTVHSLKNRGVQNIKNAKQRGDLFFRVTVETPTGLNEKQKNILREFNESCGNKNHSKKDGFFKKFKKS
ncbi:MAG: molecular chaperone DnaJ [Oscillospiraceae bacterium]|nr:molecular chaperone DnaJ [Oscillospiraceae bacterium]